MDAQSIAIAIDGNARRYGATWRTLCPLHEMDGGRHRRSFDITEKGGRLLFCCRAGCRNANIVEALRQRGLWTPQRGRTDRRFSWVHHVRQHRAPQSQPEEYRDPDFQRQYRLAHLRGGLTAATTEIASLYETARMPLTPCTLERELRLAIEVGGIGTAGLGNATIDRVIAEFSRGWCGGGIATS